MNGHLHALATKRRMISIAAVASAAALWLGLLAGTVHATAKVGEKAPEFTLTDYTGKSHSLSAYKGKVVVLEWINFGCPFVRKHYGPQNMQKLQEEFTKKGVVWLSICSSAKGKEGYFEGDALKSSVTDSKSKASAYLVDAAGTVGQLYGAKTTPHMYVIGTDGTLLYNGAIDDKPSANPDDIAGATNYVRAALEATLAGKEVAVKTVKPYGCSVKY